MATKKRRHSGLEEHQRERKTLQPPFLKIPKLAPIDGARDLLPELLWMDALLHAYGGRGLEYGDTVLDAIESVVGKDSPPRPGFISDLHVDDAQRESVMTKLATEQRTKAFPAPFPDAMLLYPGFPARYLLEDLAGHASEAVALKYLGESVLRLIDRYSDTGARANVAILRGMLRGGRMHLPPDPPLAEALTIYPNGSEVQRGLVHATARAMLNGLQGRLSPANHDWSQHFWHRNGELVRCEPNR